MNHDPHDPHDHEDAPVDFVRRRPNPSQWLNLDVLGVLVFVLVGRQNHDEGQSGRDVLITAAPFLIAMAVGWLLSKAWRTPASWKSGAVTWGTTVALGMLLRRFVFDKGTAATFIAVAMGFLALTMFTWRFVLRTIHRRMGIDP
jgi:hypothetical protein